MTKKWIFSAVFMAFCLVSCSETPKKEVVSDNTTQPQPPLVGGDRDAHGCIGSAGYQWSELRQECIRLFEKGIRLDAKAQNLDKTLSAFIVFKSGDDDAVAELYIPSQKEVEKLTKDTKDEAGRWTNAAYVLTQWKGMYTLEDNKKTVLYQGAAVK
jgi:hypothetical protein